MSRPLTSESHEPLPVVIDADIGYANDDAIAFMVALASPQLEVLALTIVAGNYGLAVEAEAAHALLETLALGAAAPVVAAGCSRPLLHERGPYADAGWGGWGTGPEPDLDRLPLLDRRHAVDVLVDLADERPGELTVIALGPLTNLALAFRKAPRLADRLAGVVAMGGAFGNLPHGAGNQTPSAEFNVWVDPEAARIVLGSGVPVTLAPLNVTRRVKLPAGLVERVRAAGGPFADVIVPELEPVLAGDRGPVERAELLEYGFMDPATVLVAARPELFRFAELHVDVDTRPGPAYGTTIAYELGDRHAAIADGHPGAWSAVVQPLPPPGSQAAPVRVVLEMDAVRVGAALEELLAAGPRAATGVRADG